MCTVGECVNSAAAMETSMEAPQIVKNAIKLRLTGRLNWTNLKIRVLNWTKVNLEECIEFCNLAKYFKGILIFIFGVWFCCWKLFSILDIKQQL